MCSTCQGKMYRFTRREEHAWAEVCECSRECRRCLGKGFLYLTQEETFSRKVGPKSYEVLAPCPCKVLERRVARFNHASVPGKFAGASFESYLPVTEAHARVKEQVREFALRYPSPRGLALTGPVGTGKTHLLAAVLSHAIIECGAEGRYVEISFLFADIRRGFREGKSGGEIIGPLAEIDLLAIDELGKGRGSPFELETLDELIARRYNAGKTTLVATNYSLRPPEQKAKEGYESTEERKDAGKESRFLFERVGDRIYSRLCEMCDFVEFPANTPDHRRARQEGDPRRAARSR